MATTEIQECEPVLVWKIREVAEQLDQRARAVPHRERLQWLKAASATRFCAALVSDGVAGYDAVMGYAWIRAAREMLRTR